MTMPFRILCSKHKKEKEKFSYKFHSFQLSTLFFLLQRLIRCFWMTATPSKTLRKGSGFTLKIEILVVCRVVKVSTFKEVKPGSVPYRVSTTPLKANIMLSCLTFSMKKSLEIKRTSVLNVSQRKSSLVSFFPTCVENRREIAV